MSKTLKIKTTLVFLSSAVLFGFFLLLPFVITVAHAEPGTPETYGGGDFGATSNYSSGGATGSGGSGNTGGTNYGGSGNTGGANYGGSGNSGGGQTSSGDLMFNIPNPFNRNNSAFTFFDFVERLVNLATKIAIPIIILFIIYSGFLFIKAQGAPEEITAARRTLGYTLLGTAIILGANIIALAVKTTITSLIQ